MSDIAVTYSALQGMVIAPNGAITYDFSGHIHAAGVDLDTAITGVTGSSRVQWKRSGSASPTPEADIYAWDFPAPGRATLVLEGGGDTGGGASIRDTLQIGAHGVRGNVNNSIPFTLLGDDESSSFVQLSPRIGRKLLLGDITATGTFTSTGGTTVFVPLVSAPAGYGLAGAIIIAAGASTHWSVSVNIAVPSFIAVTNFGATQTMSLTYLPVFD